MRIFGASEAEYYCSEFGRSTGDAQGSIEDLRKSLLWTRSRTIVEGTQPFQQYRDCSLRDVERSLFFAASHYRRSLDLMIASSSPWAHVTLYYGSWFASRALLGMFGCTIFSPNSVVDVAQGSPGQQQLRLRRIGMGQGQVNTTYKGPHRVFWDLFYQVVQSLRPMVDSRYSPALTPISGNPVWQIDKRNSINYDSFTAFRFAEVFDRSFSKSGFPTCLPGELGTQFGIMDTLVELAYSYARQFGLSTDALDGLRNPSSLRDKVRKLIYSEKAPGLVRKTKKSIFA